MLLLPLLLALALAAPSFQGSDADVVLAAAGWAAAGECTGREGDAHSTAELRGLPRSQD